MADRDYLGALSEFVCAASLDHLPAEVVDRGRRIIADCIAAIAAGMRAGEMRRFVRSLLPRGSRGSASVIGLDRGADPSIAALINGAAGTWLELDECNLAANAHPAIQVVPAAIAAAEAADASGTDLLRAVILGYEACARVGRAARMRPALHPHGTHGTIGAAVAVAVVRGYRPAEVRRLINVAATLGLATSRRTVVEGATVRNAYAGMSGHMGILADRLVRSGFTGEADAVGSIYGSIYGDAFDRDLVVRGLGSDFLIDRSCFRLHPCAIQLQSPLDLTTEAMAQGAGGRIDPGEIERVDVRCYAYAATLSHRSVTNSFGARYSIPFAVASLIHHGRPGLDLFTAEAVANPAIHRLAERVHVSSEPKYTARYPREQPCDVRLRFRDGTIAEAGTAYTRGGKEKPHSHAEMRDKFLALARRAWTKAHAEALFARCMSLERVGNVETLIGGHPTPDRPTATARRRRSGTIRG
ncbi:MAG: MmgE/PrpD family protein [Proteobacteria bacterium]|nr:MmgE/PrpD family protein [Pseudomonadota bacterium]